MKPAPPTRPPDAAVARRIKPRRKRLIGRVILLLGLSVVAAHLLFGMYERRQFAAAVARHWSAGEPVLIDDFNRRPARDLEDPAPGWRRAAAAVDPRTEDEGLLERLDFADFPLSDAEVDALTKAVAWNRSALAFARDAAARAGRPDWGVYFPRPTIGIRIPDPPRQRILVRVLRAAVLDSHRRRDDAEAIRRVREMLAQQRALFGQPPLASHYVALALGSYACGAMVRILPDLAIGSAGATDSRLVSPQQLRQIIAELLDEGPQRQSQALSYRAERMERIENLLTVVNGTVKGDSPGPLDAVCLKIQGGVLSPWLYRDGLAVLEDSSGEIEIATGTKRLPICRAAIEQSRQRSAGRREKHLFYSIFVPYFERAIRNDFYHLAQRQLVATAVALRWYAVDHGGRLPVGLTELVPGYLPQHVYDPMAADGPLKYRMGDDPAVYSIGEDGQDDGGSDEWRGPVQADMVVHLTRRPRQPAVVTDDDLGRSRFWDPRAALASP